MNGEENVLGRLQLEIIELHNLRRVSTWKTQENILIEIEEKDTQISELKKRVREWVWTQLN